MRFKDFITRQRVAILIAGIVIFIASLVISHAIGFDSLWGALSIDLAASSVTIIFTALIIDYLGLKEQSVKTLNAAGLAEDEIRATCFRINLRLARLFGLQANRAESGSISNREEAREYLNTVTREVDTYLAKQDFFSDKTPVKMEAFQRYLDRLQSSQLELEQTLILYEYALSYSLREQVLGLRTELQLAERLLGFIDISETLTKANFSLIRVTAQSVYEAVETVLQHDSQVSAGKVIQDKGQSRLIARP